MGKEHGYKIRNKEGIHFVTFAVAEWVDVFTSMEMKKITRPISWKEHFAVLLMQGLAYLVMILVFREINHREG
jgi:hypothetical protein